MQAELNRWREERGIIPYEIAVSFGVYQAEDGETNDIKQMLDFANYAMRSAKTAAGGSCFLYDEQMRNKALLEQGLEGRLAAAMEQGNSRHITSKVDMDTGQDCGLRQALRRCESPGTGAPDAGVFIRSLKRRGRLSSGPSYV
ncbi:MAG: hypothetical protein ACLRZZ_08770 [Enterocloster sp.]